MTNIIEAFINLINVIKTEFINLFWFYADGLNIDEIIATLLLLTILLIFFVEFKKPTIASQSIAITGIILLVLVYPSWIISFSNFSSPWPLWIKVAILSIIGLSYLAYAVFMLILFVKWRSEFQLQEKEKINIC